ncbi:hypothetical protein BDZ45DRAFT_354035 [Acephala macrosclerotiorum]|nr:hypothetical protein BDZ45DRAFT_354035 [Acephala macrosclerotiorum]
MGPSSTSGTEIRFFLAHPKISDTHAGVKADMLLVHYLVTQSRSTYFYDNELIYDEHYVSFQKIISISSTITTRQIALRVLHKGLCFTLDIVMAQPLYFIVRKCRDSYLKLKAIDEMKEVDKMGVYLGRTVAKVSVGC